MNLLLQEKFTDEEIYDKLKDHYSSFKSCSIGGINYIRRLYNMEASAVGQKTLDRFIRNDEGELIRYTSLCPFNMQEDKKEKRIIARRRTK